ncbi:UNC93-like protein [Arctopsyche grandis]|uniref:UNC93-like protein n=1 Tax=Arctopsyche grandis TaxID=121162 RepID=UPI00406D81A5
MEIDSNMENSDFSVMDKKAPVPIDDSKANENTFDVKNEDLECSDDNDELPPGEKRRIMKNVIVVSLAFMVHFTAFQGAVNLQSSINADGGLGTASLASIYASLIVSNLFLPVVMINWLGCKWVIAVSFVAYMPYIVTNFFPYFYTMIPAGLIVGFGGGPLWCAKCTYLTVVAGAYSKLTGIKKEVLVVRFFGLFFMIFQFAQVWGNLISSLVLASGEKSNKTEVNTMEICGANFIATESEDALNEQPKEKIQTIAGIYLGCMVLACIIVAVGVDNLSRYEKKRQGSGTGLTGIQLLAITLKLLKEKNQLLILCITIWLGLGQAFVGADYTSAFVACAWGTENIGYVMICYGLCNSISAISTGSLVKITGRPPVVCSAMILQLGIIITLLLWKPTPDDIPIYFVISGLWGVCDGVWLVQINALCGILFPGREEAAYSNFRLWESLGFIVAYIYSPFIYTYAKLYILLVVLILGMIGYLAIEVILRREADADSLKRDLAINDENDMGKTNKAFNKEE